MIQKTTTSFFLCVIAVFAALTFFDNKTYAEEKTGGCITSSCHPKIVKDKFVHGPVDAGECIVCHGDSQKHKDNPAKNKFSKIKQIDKLCYTCHDKFKERQFTHAPVKSGECTACHSAHSSPYKFQLVAQGAELCFICHDAKIVAGKFVHGPAAVGGCVACHEPHTADYEKNLKAKPTTLCFSCHTDQAEKFMKAKVIHKPVAENCAKCHNPHSAEKQFMMSAEIPELCFNCHKDKKEWLDKASVQHGALAIGKKCLNCHEPHSSNIAKRLSMAPLELCLSCHDKEVQTPDGRTLVNMKKLLSENKDHHGPIKENDCSGCHNPHGSSNFRILKEPYPSVFYMSYNADNYNLCFSCHEKTIVQDPQTTKLTNFRNGEVNLHFRHVNKIEKGRTCRACHETHASNYPKHIREAVPFGAWELPLNFQMTATGGSCTPGCHKLKKYDRVKKEINP
ncbi:MAG: cytochrome C [Nitrospirae bacterium]|nr:cytochrome C [Nitrospirota bacterium]